jgi:hypothetical protein
MNTFSSACMIAVLSTFAAGSIAADPFERSIRPLLHEYCVTCHSTQEQQGELDLQRFDSLDQVKRHADIWNVVKIPGSRKGGLLTSCSARRRHPFFSERFAAGLDRRRYRSPERTEVVAGNPP